VSDHWPLIPLADITHRITKGTTPTSVGGRFTDEGINYFKVESVAPDGALVRDKLAFIDDKTHEILRRSQLAVNDVLFSIAGAIGRTYLVREADLPANTNQALAIVRFDKSKVVPRYAFYAMRQYAFQGDALGRVVQTAQANVNLTQLSNAKLVLPSLTEQQGIVDLVGTYDDLIENNRRRMALLEEAARQLYREWFVRLHFPGHEHTRIIDGVPEGWEHAPFESALILQRGFDLPVQAREEGEIPIYGSMGINGFHNRSKVAGPGVVTGRSGTLGAVHFVAGDYWPLNTALWVKEFKRLTPLFALFLMREMDLKQYNGGASVPTLDRKAVHRVEILIPPKKLISMFEDFAQANFKQIENLAEQNEKLRGARDLLLPRLMSGDIAV